MSRRRWTLRGGAPAHVFWHEPGVCLGRAAARSARYVYRNERLMIARLIRRGDSTTLKRVDGIMTAAWASVGIDRKDVP